MDLVAQTHRYFNALSEGVIGDSLKAFYAPTVIQQEFPNRLMPNGASRDLAGILSAAESGQHVMGNHAYELLNIVVDGNSVAVEFLWSATALIDLGMLPAGSVMKGRFASFLDFENELIVSQRSYDCFDPW